MTKDKLRLIPAAEARRILAGAASPVGTEAVALADAAGRVLAQAVAATEDVPSFPRSLMDGFAIRAADVADARDGQARWLKVVGTVPMGSRADKAVGPGQAMSIATGGHLPEGADCVVMVEHVVTDSERGVGFSAPVDPGKNVIHIGEDIRRGNLVLSPGRRLRPADIGVLAAFGLAEIIVYRRPRVAVVSTGTELCAPTERPRPGQVRDINQHILAAQVVAAGCVATRAGIVPDEPAAIESTVRALMADHDVVVLSGGSSIGGRDFTAEVFARLGAPGILFHGIDVRPGKPTLVAQAGPCLLVGTPGVPTSSLIIFDVFIRATLWRLGGETHRSPWPVVRTARLTRAYASARGREDYLRVRLSEKDGEAWADPLPGGSAALSGVSRADGLVVVSPDVVGVAAGDPVSVCLFV